MKKLSIAFAAFALAAFARGDVRFAAGGWDVEFASGNAALKLSHRGSGAVVDGSLAFLGPARATDPQMEPTVAWRVADPRDGVANRLAILDANGDAQGYVGFRPDGDRLRILAYHRTALAYRGDLSFSGEIRTRGDAFAANATPERGDRVLQLASGPADSLRFDALFSPSRDEALRIAAPGGGPALASRSPGVWAFAVRLRIDDPAEAEASFAVERDYYRSRWVPRYAPIDRERCPRAPTGWMSWNVYFDKAGSKENLDEARIGARLLKPFGLEFWSIESWQGNSPHLPVSDFHNMNLEHYEEQFPEGMKWLADEIRKLGFRPGLWMAPFGTGNAGFYRAHKGWFLHGADGRPLSCWNGRYTLDPTVAEARDHLRGIFRSASRDWGYEFFKIDGMSGRGPAYCAHMYERPEVRARFADPSCPNPFELCVKAFREGIGSDRVFLACQGHFTGAEAGYADASRTGADVVSPNRPVAWENVMRQARCTVNQIFVHNVVFWADPDCMMVGQDALGVEQARVEATVVALPGQQTFAGDKLGELAPDRVRLLQQSLPACDARPGNLYPQFGRLPVWNLGVKRPFGDWHVVALFNWDDEPKSVGFDWGEIGEDAERAFACWEFWTERWMGVAKGRFEMQVPARAVRLVAMQPFAARPQFLTSDRHISQGGVELKDLSWKDGELSAAINVVGGFPLTARFLVPEGFAFVAATAPDGVSAATRFEADGRILAVTLATPQTRDATISLSFSR